MFSVFFLYTLYAQQVLHYSALQTGISLLAVAAASIFASGGAEALVTRAGPKVVLATGMVLMGIAMVWFAQIDVNGTYFADLLGPSIVLGVGAGFSFVPISIVALTGVRQELTGVASGLMNTTQQVGGAVGLAAVATIFTTRVTHQLAGGVAPPQALVSGFSYGFWTLAIFAFVGALATVLILRKVHVGVGEEHQADVTQVTSPFCFNKAATEHLTSVVLGDDAPAAAQAPTV
jgi:MFS family permease